jgi:hypothetical protein
MQTIEVETELTTTKVQDDPLAAGAARVTLTTQQHRIYVWSSPSPFAVVIDQNRSFLTRD